MSDCANEGVNLFWSLTLGYPRLFLIPPAIFLTTVRVSISNQDTFWLLEGLSFLIVSVPIVIVFFVGIRFWHRNSLILGWLLATMIVAETVVLSGMQ